jgi:hypothetical protein
VVGRTGVLPIRAAALVGSIVCRIKQRGDYNDDVALLDIRKFDDGRWEVDVIAMMHVP